MKKQDFEALEVTYMKREDYWLLKVVETVESC